MWLPDVPHFDADGKSQPGKQYVVRRREHPDIVLLPEGGATAELRHQFYFSRRKRPMVPAPVNTPMPDKQGTKEKKSRLFCVYMRPWVLDRRFASPLVPHLCDLDVVPNTSSAVPAAANFVGALHSSNESTTSTARSFASVDASQEKLRRILNRREVFRTRGRGTCDISSAITSRD